MNDSKISSVISVFQDGILEKLSYEGKDLNFKIECQAVIENYFSSRAKIASNAAIYFRHAIKFCTGLV